MNVSRIQASLSILTLAFNRSKNVNILVNYTLFHTTYISNPKRRVLGVRLAEACSERREGGTEAHRGQRGKGGGDITMTLPAATYMCRMSICQGNLKI